MHAFSPHITFSTYGHIKIDKLCVISYTIIRITYIHIQTHTRTQLHYHFCIPSKIEKFSKSHQFYCFLLYMIGNLCFFFPCTLMMHFTKILFNLKQIKKSYPNVSWCVEYHKYMNLA